MEALVSCSDRVRRQFHVRAILSLFRAYMNGWHGSQKKIAFGDSALLVRSHTCVASISSFEIVNGHECIEPLNDACLNPFFPYKLDFSILLLGFACRVSDT